MPDFFRIEEVLLITYSDIKFHSGYVISNLEVSKTDQLRKGNQVVNAESSNDDSCPVKIFKPYLSHLESSPVDPSHYVFRAPSKTRSGHTLVSSSSSSSFICHCKLKELNFSCEGNGEETSRNHQAYKRGHYYC